MPNLKKIVYLSLASLIISNTANAKSEVSELSRETPILESELNSKDKTNLKKIIFKSNNKTVGYKDLEENIEKIFSMVQNIRNLNSKKSVTVGIKDTQELAVFLGKMFEEEYKDEDIRKDYLSLLHFGLIKKDVDLKKTFLKLYTEQIAGFYDNKSRELYVIDNPKISEIESSIVISHELIHALQDQYFDLTKFMKNDNDQDKALARLSLIEGEAMLGSTEYLSKSIVADGLKSIKTLGSLFKNPMGSTSTEALKQTPGVLVEQMMFPYTEGMKFSAYMKKELGGWQNFSKLYNNPPVSTEQIMHPEKYVAGEKPVNVEINNKFFNDKNYPFIKKDTLGEFFLLNYFLEYLSEDESEKASNGWGGDNSVLFADKNNNTIFVYKSVWDTSIDAKEFFEAYKRSLKIRYGKELLNAKESDSYFTAKSPNGLIQVNLKDKSVNVAEGFNEKNKDIFIKYVSLAKK